MRLPIFFDALSPAGGRTCTTARKATDANKNGRRGEGKEVLQEIRYFPANVSTTLPLTSESEMHAQERERDARGNQLGFSQKERPTRRDG